MAMTTYLHKQHLPQQPSNYPGLGKVSIALVSISGFHRISAAAAALLNLGHILEYTRALGSLSH